ncbi:MAG: methyltransferase domain-containing protein [Deltaproteobacteria bacterium]|nr:methyltransferase domain-containing protein [Deltaproteobacteria bacterium]
MRILESAPDRYDAGMRVLSLGAVPRLHEQAARLAVHKAGARVLEIGCGTGAVTRLLLERGANVEALDHSPEMLDRARARLGDHWTGRLLLRESTAAEIDALPAASFDAVVASLSLSEMSASERTYVLAAAVRALAPGGRVVIADELRPRLLWQRTVHVVVRLPLALLTWIVTGTTTHAIADLGGELAAAGLRTVEEHRSALGTLAAVAAERER